MAPEDVIKHQVARLDALWETSGQPVTVQFSARLTRSLGIAYLDRRLIRIREDLRRAPPGTLEQVLCHELAHVVTYERHGRSVRPHGAEWQALVRAAGYEPSVYWAGAALEAPPRKRYLHMCPVCDARRVAGRRMRRWRCDACRRQGRDGRLVIREVRT